MECASCKKKFRGVYAYSRHVDAKNDRCRTARELWDRGLHLRNGYWCRVPPVGQTAVLPGMARRGAQSVAAAHTEPDGTSGHRSAQRQSPAEAARRKRGAA